MLRLIINSSVYLKVSLKTLVANLEQIAQARVVYALRLSPGLYVRSPLLPILQTNFAD